MSFGLYIAYLIGTYLRPFDILWPEAAVYRPMLILWAVAFVAALPHALSTQRLAARPVHFGLIFALIASVALSLIVNGFLGGAVAAVLEFSPSAMLFVLTVLNVTDVDRLKRAVIVVGACLFGLSIAGLYAYYTGWNAADLVLAQSTGLEAPVGDWGDAPADDHSGMTMWRIRSLGFLSDPNDFAQALVMLLPLCALLRGSVPTMFSTVRAAVPCAILCYTIYLTHSRGALIGLASLMFFSVKRKLGTWLTAALIAIGVVILAAGVGDGRAFSGKEASAAQRLDAWYDGLQMVKAQPLFGVGYGNFTEHHPELTAHNSYVLCFAELGLVGYIAWLGLVVVVFRELSHAVDGATPSSNGRRWSAAFRASLIGYMTCAWFLSRTYQPGLYLLLALGVCAASLASRGDAALPAEATAAAAPPWFRPTLAVAFASFVLVYLFVRLG